MMKDRVFEGRDVAGALEAASLGLGVPVAQLRYVLLDTGRPETSGGPVAGARIAVMLDASASPPREDGPPARAAAVGPRPRGAAHDRLRRMVAAVAEASDSPLDVRFEEGEETLVVRVSGPGEALLLENGGEALRALEHLLQRAVAGSERRRVQLTSARFRAERDAYLAARAAELAALVRSDGTPRETEPLNSYDRRIVHLALQAAPDVRSFSVGEGSARRVTVAPRLDPSPPGSRPEVQ